MKKHNFFAGPAILPEEVKAKTQSALMDFRGMGLSIMEISHRSPEFTDVLESAVQNVRDILDLTDDYAVLFLTGGASSQFYMTAMNLLDENETVGFLDTGTWALKSMKEAAKFGNVHVLASSKDKNYTYIPKGFTIPENLKYVHLTSNNTICGTQIMEWPDTPVPFVCDMSSDIFSRKIPVNRFWVIYAGAQKNIGPAGVTMVLVRKDILGQVNRDLPTMLRYKTHVEKNSTFNTPPVLPIYVTKLTLDWIKSNGGLAGIEARNKHKADLLYAEIDRNPLFQGTVMAEDRSRMNATFVPLHEDHEKPFLEYCVRAGIVGIKGHRSVGGFRASIYNAMPAESVEVLVDVMRNFEKDFG